MQKNYGIREAAVFHFAADLCHQLFTTFSPTSCLYFASHNILSSLQPLQAHNIVSVSAELEGRGIRMCIQNYSVLSVVCTKIPFSTTVKIRNVCIKVAVSFQRNGLLLQYFPRTCKRSRHCKVHKKVSLPTYVYYISTCMVTYLCFFMNSS